MAVQFLNGSCHCGAVAYTVEADPATAMTCNCSICSRLGAVWTFAPKAKFKLTKAGLKRLKKARKACRTRSRRR